MKVKSLYIYITAIAVVILALFILSTGTSSEVNNFAMNMQNLERPEDNIHKGLSTSGEGMPSKSNVSQDIMQRMVKLKTEVEANPNDTAMVRQYADLIGMAHKQEEAIDLYNSIIAKDPKRIDIYLSLTLLYYNQGNLLKAEECTNNILKYDPQNLEAIYNSGIIYAAKGNKERAKEIWEGLVKNYPDTEAADFARQSLQKLN